MSYSPLKGTLETLNGILDGISKISWLGGAQNSLNRLQVSVDNTPAVTVSSGTVTTCSTLSNQTSLGGVNAISQVPALMNIEATLCNIDNIYIS